MIFTDSFILYILLLTGTLLFLWVVGIRTPHKKLTFISQARSTAQGPMPHVTKDKQVRYLSGLGRVTLSPGRMTLVTTGIRIRISGLVRIIKDLILPCDRCHSAQVTSQGAPPPPIDASEMVMGQLGRKTNAGYLWDRKKVYNTYNIDDSIKIERYRGYWCRGVSFVFDWIKEMPRHILCGSRKNFQNFCVVW